MNSKKEIQNLESRLKKLAQEKSYYQLMANLMGKLSSATGLDNTLEKMLSIVMENMGGTNLYIYYILEGKYFYMNIYGDKKSVAEIDDPEVKNVFVSKKPLSIAKDFADSGLKTRHETYATDWIFPLMVGMDIIGVFKIENTIISITDEVQKYLEIFFNYAAIILYHEINNYSNLKVAHEQLNKINQRINYIIDGTQTGTWEWNIQTGETIFNERWAEIIGYTLQEISPVSIKTWEKYAHPDDLLMSDDLITKHLSGELEYYECETRMKHKDGYWIWILDRGKVMKWDDNEKPLWMSGTHQDITSRKKIEEALKYSEEKFSKAFQNSPDVIAIITLDDAVIIELNDSITRFTNYKKEELIGKSLIKLNILNEIADIENYVNILKVQGRVNNFETTFRKKSGEILYCLVSGEIIQLNGVICILSIIHDISERKKAEEALKESEIHLRKLNATKDKIFSIIAHDLRNPVNSIYGLADILYSYIKNNDKEKSLKFIEQINYATKQTLDLLENLLEWAKTQTGNIKFNPHHIKLKLLVDDIKDLLSMAARIKNITVNCSCVENIMIYADYNMLHTIIRNLLSNAIKFTKKGGEVNIYAKTTQNETIVTIEDNGIGIGKETQDLLFKTEFSYSTSGTANEKGSGLGLSLCKEFVLKHSGKIWVTSEIGKGSGFHFSFPNML